MTKTNNPQLNLTFFKRLRPILGFVFFILSVGLGLLVSFITLREDLVQFNWLTFLETSAQWLERWPMMAIALVLLMTVILTSGLRLHVILKIKHKHQRFQDSLMYGILARYYVLITPWGLGGQPIVMGIMHKKNVPLGLATSAPMLDLLLMRFAMFIFVLTALIGYGYLVDPLIYLFAWIGFFFTCFIPVVMIMASFHPIFSQLVLDVFGWLIPLKKKASWRAKLELTLHQYRDAFALIRNRPFAFLLVGLFALLSQFALLAIPFFVISSFNLTVLPIPDVPFNLLSVIMMMAFANTILGTIPTLGSAGAAEFTFTTVFTTFITGNVLFWATFLWRFLLFYLWLIMGIIITIMQGIFAKREHRRHHLPNRNLPLKVFIFNDGFFPLIDGVVRAVDGYARYLVSQGVDVTVVVPFRGDRSLYPYKILAIPQIKIPGFFYPIPYGFNRKRILDAIYYEGPAIYHAHTPFLIGRLALNQSRRNHIPILATFHSKYFDDYYAATKNLLIRDYLKRKTIQFFSRVDRLATVSEATLKTMRQYGIKQSPIMVIPNGTDLVKVDHKDLTTVYDQYGLDQTTPILLFVGQLIWQKNLKLILDTYHILNKKGLSFQAIFVGEGRDQQAIQTYCQSLEISQKIIFTGKITDQHLLSKIYQIASLFFFPSQYDNDPIVLKEAALHELPSLVMANTSIAQLIVNQENGFVQGGNASRFAKRITDILNQPDVLKNIGIQAKKSLVLRWEDTLKPLPKFYQDIIDDYYSS
jgi:1,2-diacylglycerol 3-alpha-glucosyltransferase